MKGVDRFVERATRAYGAISAIGGTTRRAKVYAGTDLLTGREIRFRKTERAAQIELGKLLAMAQAGQQLISGESPRLARYGSLARSRVLAGQAVGMR